MRLLFRRSSPFASICINGQQVAATEHNMRHASAPAKLLDASFESCADPQKLCQTLSESGCPATELRPARGPFTGLGVLTDFGQETARPPSSERAALTRRSLRLRQCQWFKSDGQKRHQHRRSILDGEKSRTNRLRPGERETPGQRQ